MREAVWGYAVIVLGILAIGIIWFFANSTKTDQHNYNLLKETVEASMLDAVDLAAYRSCETDNITQEDFKKVDCIKIDEEKFVENFIRRFAESAELSKHYVIEIYDINEAPPKVSLKVSSTEETTATGEVMEFNIVNNIDAILETKYKKVTTSNQQTQDEQYSETENNILEHDGNTKFDEDNTNNQAQYDGVEKRKEFLKVYKGKNQIREIDVVPSKPNCAAVKSLKVGNGKSGYTFSGKNYTARCSVMNGGNTIECDIDCQNVNCDVEVTYEVEFEC